jgi:transposase
MVYDKRSATFYRNKASFSTVNRRVESDFELPADSPTPYEQYVLPEEYEFRASTLQYDKVADEFYSHITTRKHDDDEPEGSIDTGHQTVLGIDLGANSLAVASTGTFWQGDDYDHWCREFEKRRGEM